MAERDVLHAVIEHLAADALSAEEELCIYRQMAQVALAQNSELMRVNQSLREQISQRREELRRYVSAAVSA